MLSSRPIFGLIFLFCLSLLGFGLYLQHVKGLEPCPLCIMQRIAFALVGTTALFAALHNPVRVGATIYAVLILTFSGIGAAFAGRQIWLQHLPPDKVPECGPGLDFMLEAYPLSETLLKVFKGTGDCAEIKWTFVGLSIPQWSFVIFLLIAVFSLWRIFARPKERGLDIPQSPRR